MLIQCYGGAGRARGGPGIRNGAPPRILGGVRTPLPDRYDDDEPLGPEVSPRSRGVALVLGLLGGFLGLHRFYVGKPGTAVLQIVTFGGMGVWWLYDVVLIVSAEFRDKDDLPLRAWSVEQGGDRGGATMAQVRQLTDDVEQLRRELGEMAERMDFTERILAKQKDRDRLPS